MSNDTRKIKQGDALQGVNGVYAMNSKAFNTEFDRTMSIQDSLAKYQEDLRLGTINTDDNDKKMDNITDLTIGQIAGNMSWQFEGLAVDLLHGKINRDTFSQQHRLFYLGLFIISVGVLVWGIDYGFSE